MAINIRGIANAAIQTVNPDVTVTVRRSAGSTSYPGGVRTPNYTDSSGVVQVQALAYGDIRQLDSLNIQGTRRAIYVTGPLFGLIRAAQKGGDILVFAPGTLPEGDTWLCVHVLENWPTWTKIAITLQDGG